MAMDAAHDYRWIDFDDDDPSALVCRACGNVWATTRDRAYYEANTRPVQIMIPFPRTSMETRSESGVRAVA